jgi:hypothetical protein
MLNICFTKDILVVQQKRFLNALKKSSCGDLLKNTLKNHKDVNNNNNNNNIFTNTFQILISKLMFFTFVEL